MPQTVCSASGKSATSDETKNASGWPYSVTVACQAAAPLKAERLFQRWLTVQTPSGTTARSEPSRARRKLAGRSQAADRAWRRQ